MLKKLEHIRKGIGSLRNEIGAMEHKIRMLEELIDELTPNAVEQADAPDHKGAVVDEQDDEPVCECGHAKKTHWHLAVPQIYENFGECCLADCGCEGYRPPSGR